MQDYEQLKVFQKAHALIAKVYRMTEVFPDAERYGLVSQLRRASVSIATNLAEGSKRRSARDFAHFVNMAEGSAAEVRCLITVARDLDEMKLAFDVIGADPEIAAEPMLALCIEVEKMLYAFRVAIEKGER